MDHTDSVSAPSVFEWLQSLPTHALFEHMAELTAFDESMSGIRSGMAILRAEIERRTCSAESIG